MSKSYNIITSVKTKSSGDSYSDPIYIGAEQRFIKALLNSNNNSLEEQLLLGVDCITVEWTESDSTTGTSKFYITKKFYGSDQPPKDGYFILFSYYPSHEEISQKLADFISFNDADDIAEDGTLVDSIVFDPYVKKSYGMDVQDVSIQNSIMKFDETAGVTYNSNDKSLKFDNDQSLGFNYYYSNGRISLNLDKMIAREDTLCFRVDTTSTSDVKIGSDILISRKITEEREEGSKKIITERIQNFL